MTLVRMIFECFKIQIEICCVNGEINEARVRMSELHGSIGYQGILFLFLYCFVLSTVLEMSIPGVPLSSPINKVSSRVWNESARFCRPSPALLTPRVFVLDMCVNKCEGFLNGFEGKCTICMPSRVLLTLSVFLFLIYVYMRIHYHPFFISKYV
jgi:hypothetical protein